MLRSQPYNNCESIIIYCTRQQTTERIAQLLRTSLQLMDNTHVRLSNSDHKRILWDIDCYHAGLSTAHRKHVQSDFMSGKLRIIVATIAFGMGLNKPDVRAIIHYNMPQSFESFVQEIGRAGRDGNPAYCHVFISDDVSFYICIYCSISLHYRSLICLNYNDMFILAVWIIGMLRNLFNTFFNPSVYLKYKASYNVHANFIS